MSHDMDAGRPVSTTPQHTRVPSSHLNALDGVRAIAVAFVLGYHLIPGAVPAGILGVDVFFVLSGFLITSLLIGQWKIHGRVDYVSFTRRRLRRLFPALALTVLVCTTLALCVGGDALIAIRRQFFSSLVFVSNWVEIGAGSSYFDHTQPLLLTHMWSLAVEAQFYVVWPLLLWALFVFVTRVARPTLRLASVVAAAFSIASAAWALYLLFHGASPSRVHMGTDTHAFGLMLGASMALWRGSRLDGSDHEALTPTVRQRRGLIGWCALVILVVTSFVDITDVLSSSLAPLGNTGILIFASVAAAALIAALLPEVHVEPTCAHLESQRSIVRRCEQSMRLMWRNPAQSLALLLSWRPLVWFGQRSYGIYLWHWPLAVLSFYAFPHLPLWLSALLVTVGATIAADASFRWIESPARRMGVRAWLRRTYVKDESRLTNRRIGVAIAVSCACVAALLSQPTLSSAQEAIIAGQKAASTPSRIDARTIAPLTGLNPLDNEAAYAQQRAAEAAAAEAAKQPQFAQVNGEQVSVIGDSVTLGAQGALQTALPGIVVDGEVSRSFMVAGDVLATLDATWGARDYVVVSLATNTQVDAGQLEALFASLAPQRRLVVVTAYGPPRTTWIPPSNDAIRAFASAHPDRVRVASWDRAIAERTDLLAQDLVHPHGEGTTLYAQVIADALGTFPLEDSNGH
ncbi:acyltransferase family protein [Schaalia suimastitidis]|uniref:acyltransferase family protein n=1 Tax=Schaalia suimastitidis TaxID=121163 RepID=UPI000687000E|nr:acyltransferase family protein [Schaalia suimastitidis]